MGGKGGGGQLPDYEQLIRDSAYWNRLNQLGPSESMVFNTDRTMGARVLSPAEQLRQELMMGMGNTALGTLMGWYGGTPASFGSFDPVTGTYGNPGTSTGIGQGVTGSGGKDGSAPAGLSQAAWDSMTPEQREAWAEILGPVRMAEAGSGQDWYDPYVGGEPGGLPGVVGGPYEGLDFGDQPFLQALIDDALGSLGGGGGGLGGGSSSYSYGGPGVNFGDMTEMVTFDENGNPNIGPGFAEALGFRGFDAYLPEEGDLMAARNRAEDAVYDRLYRRAREDYDLTRQQQAEALANRGVVEGSEGFGEASYLQDRAWNDRLSNIINEAVSQGRQEHQMLWGQGFQLGQGELQRAIQDAMLQNQAQQGMIGANLGARTQEANEAIEAARAAMQARAQSQSNRQFALQHELQRLGLGLQAQRDLFGQQLSERSLLYNELAGLLGLGAPAGMQGYWQPGMVDVNAASNAAMQNAMFNFQSNPLTMLFQAGTNLGSAAIGAGMFGGGGT